MIFLRCCYFYLILIYVFTNYYSICWDIWKTDNFTFWDNYSIRLPNIAWLVLLIILWNARKVSLRTIFAVLLSKRYTWPRISTRVQNPLHPQGATGRQQTTRLRGQRRGSGFGGRRRGWWITIIENTVGSTVWFCDVIWQYQIRWARALVTPEK